MSINQSYAVFGLGRYGLAVARELVKHGSDVLAVDTDEAIVNSAIGEIPFCKCADVTDPEVLKLLGIENIDVVIVAMANNLEASVLTVMLCKEAGVKTVIAKCANETHRKVLSKVGADKVVFPENEAGTRLAKNLLSAGFMDVIELSDDVSLIDLDVKADWVGKTIAELNLRKKYSFNIVAIRQDGKIQTEIDPNAALTEDMNLVVVIKKSKLNKIRSL